jgi:hypothetical protein
MHAGHPPLAYSLAPTTVLETEELAHGSNLVEMLVLNGCFLTEFFLRKGTGQLARAFDGVGGAVELGEVSMAGSRALVTKLIYSVVELGAREILNMTTMTRTT